jgi:hypothetical protein
MSLTFLQNVVVVMRTSVTALKKYYEGCPHRKFKISEFYWKNTAYSEHHTGKHSIQVLPDFCF